jgi:hypothetical protein
MLLRAVFLCFAAAHTAAAAAPRARGARRLDDALPPLPAGPLTGKFSNLNMTSLGPAVPVFEADVPPLVDVFASDPSALGSPLVPPAIRLLPFASCVLGKAVPSCAGNLSLCFAADPTTLATVCGCFTKYAQCYAAAGCIEALPAADVSYCTDVVFCPKPQCDLSGAAGVSAGVAALAAAFVAALAAAQPPSDDDDDRGE